MDRRTFLFTTLATGSSVFGGCVRGSGDSGGTGQAPTGSTETPKPPASASSNGSPTDSTPVEGVVVDDIVVRKAVRYESTMGSGGVLAGDGQQYVVASVRADRRLSAADFRFETGDNSWSPGLPDTAGGLNRAVAGRDGGPVGRNIGDDGSYLAFTIPSPLSASSARIRFSGADDATWPLSTELETRLAAPTPEFTLDSLDVPERVSQGHPLPISLTVRNVSETTGRFLAALYWPTKRIADDDEARILEREVDAGDAVSVSVEIDTQYTTNESEPVTLAVRGHVTAEREIQVQDASTPS